MKANKQAYFSHHQRKIFPRGSFWEVFLMFCFPELDHGAYLNQLLANVKRFAMID